jgi:PAS domain-containing protein
MIFKDELDILGEIDRGNPLEIMVTLGRDSRVVYQNPASRALKTYSFGKSLIRVTDFFNAEEIRDKVFVGETVRYVEQEIRIGRRTLWVTRVYEPLTDADGKIVGMISQGNSALKTGVELLAQRRLNRLIQRSRRASSKRG